MAEQQQKKKTSRVSSARAKAVEKTAIVKEKTVVVGVAKQASGFVAFIRDQGIVGIAVGLAIGTAAGTTVKDIVNGFVNPVVQLLVGEHKSLETATWYVDIWGRKTTFAWGATLSSLITLLATVYVIYLIVHFGRLDRLKKQEL